jgi:hypothetical protein
MERSLCPDFIVLVQGTALGGGGKPMFARVFSQAETDEFTEGLTDDKEREERLELLEQVRSGCLFSVACGM